MARIVLTFVLLNVLAVTYASPTRKADNRQAASLPDVDLNALRRTEQSAQMGQKGDKEAAQGNWASAKAAYQQALSLWPDNQQALYGIGQCANVQGDKASAIKYYRKAIFTSDPHRYGTVPGDGYRENDVGKLMEYVLLLSQAGQTREALSVYRRAAGLLNYEDGKQNIDVLLPDFGPGGWSYTPQRLQAMAHIAIGYGKEGFNDDLAMSHFQKAVALAPDSPLPYYYRGRHRVVFNGNPQDSQADYTKAAHLGNAQVRMAVNKAMKSIR